MRTRLLREPGRGADTMPVARVREEPDWERRNGHQLVDDVQEDAGGGLKRTASSQQQSVEARVQHDDAKERDRRSEPHRECERYDERDTRERAEPVAPAEVERRRRGPVAEHQTYPRDAAHGEIGADHAPEIPVLKVLPLDERIEDDLRAVRRQTHPELDVLDRMLDEAARTHERIAPDCPQAGPKRRDLAGGILVNVVMEEVPKAGDDASLRRVIVGAKDRHKLRVELERLPDSSQGVEMHLDVSIDEHKQVADCAACASIARNRRSCTARLVDDHDLVLGLNRGAHGSKSPLERLRPISRGNDHAQSHL